jgi:hypothetical protein
MQDVVYNIVSPEGVVGGASYPIEVATAIIAKRPGWTMQVSQVKRRTKKVIGSNHKRSDVWG